jgi:uncharacterized membrane protein
MTHSDRPEEAKAQEVPGAKDTAIPRSRSIEIEGAIPHPQLLSQYDQILSAGAERIVGIVESQVHHRQSMEARGQVFAFSLAVIILVGGMVLVAMGKGAQGLAPLVIAVAGLGGLFVYRETRPKMAPTNSDKVTGTAADKTLR